MEKNKINFSDLKRYKLKDRFSKVNAEGFSKPKEKIFSFSDFIETLPDMLKADDFKEFVSKTSAIIRAKKQLMLSFGGHVIKVGLSPLVIDMIKSGYITHIAMNGSGMIHDFEIAFNSSTSENVDVAIEDGTFGMAEETGKFINEAIVSPEEGLGYNIGKFIHESDFPNKNLSILGTCYEKGVPVTVHVAYGTDIIHYHPEFDPSATGLATHSDFKKFIYTVSKLNGGAFINFGSAVIIPEIFLKAVTVVRNLGYNLKEVYTANFDFVHQYRSATNIVKRPTSLGGKGFYFIGHHELMLPLLYSSLKESLRI